MQKVRQKSVKQKSTKKTKNVLKKAKNNKIQGPGNIKIELLKYRERKLVTYIKKKFNRVEKVEEILTEWKLYKRYIDVNI